MSSWLRFTSGLLCLQPEAPDDGDDDAASDEEATFARRVASETPVLLDAFQMDTGLDGYTDLGVMIRERDFFLLMAFS